MKVTNTQTQAMPRLAQARTRLERNSVGVSQHSASTSLVSTQARHHPVIFSHISSNTDVYDFDLPS
eukprot:5498252-Amphidinium_carterae.1